MKRLNVILSSVFKNAHAKMLIPFFKYEDAAFILQIIKQDFATFIHINVDVSHKHIERDS